MSGQFLRYLTMLQQMPTVPKKTTTRDLQTALEQHGFTVSQRTIQRDLKSFMAVLPGLQVDDARDFPGWSKIFVDLFFNNWHYIHFSIG